MYLNKYAYFGSDGIDYGKISFFCHSIIPDLSETEMREVFNRYKSKTRLWDNNAPVFQQPQYKNLIFVDDIFELPKRKLKRAELRSFSKPLFINNGEYAFVVESHDLFYKCSGWNWKKPWKSFRRGIGMYFITEDRVNAYRLINGKWVNVGSMQISSGHF